MSKQNSLILTCYLTTKPHPQAIDPTTFGLDHTGYVIKDSYKYIKPWYESIIKQNLKGIVFYDGLSDDFVDKYSCDNVEFIKVEQGKYTNNDQRFFYYLDYLCDHIADHNTIFMTDCCDVTVVKDPSSFNDELCLYFCRDSMPVNDYTFLRYKFYGMCKILKCLSLEKYKKIKDMPLLNMGVVGGDSLQVLRFLRLFRRYREAGGLKQLNTNMVLGNVIAREHFSCIRSGPPFCSEFKKYQTDRKDVGFIHK